MEICPASPLDKLDLRRGRRYQQGKSEAHRQAGFLILEVLKNTGPPEIRDPSVSQHVLDDDVGRVRTGFSGWNPPRELGRGQRGSACPHRLGGIAEATTALKKRYLHCPTGSLGVYLVCAKRNLTCEPISRNMHISSPASVSVPPGYHKIWGAVKMDQTPFMRLSADLFMNTAAMPHTNGNHIGTRKKGLEYAHAPKYTATPSAVGPSTKPIR